MNFARRHYEDSNDSLHVLDILNEMRHAGLETAFIFSLMEYCQKYEGLRDLMEMWFTESVSKERDKIIADLQESLEDIQDFTEKPIERPTLSISDFEGIKNDIAQFKQFLREEVDRQGGISELARKTGIPQPSLSRFFIQFNASSYNPLQDCQSIKAP